MEGLVENINREDSLKSSESYRRDAIVALQKAKEIEKLKLESGYFEYVDVDHRTKVLRKIKNYDTED